MTVAALPRARLEARVEPPPTAAHPPAVTLAPAGGVRIAARARLPTGAGPFEILSFVDAAGADLPHVALVAGDLSGSEAALARVHSSCLTGDVLGSLRCDCGAQLDAAMTRIAAAGRGVILYLHQEGRGIGLANKVRAYALQDAGADTVEANEALGFPADLRDFAVAADMLRVLGVAKVRLLTNNPRKVEALEAAGIRVEEREPLVTPASPHSRAYLETKRASLGHLIPPVLE